VVVVVLHWVVEVEQNLGHLEEPAAVVQLELQHSIVGTIAHI
jgi:hypothetical protein